MAIIRFQAVHDANNRKPIHKEAPSKKTSDYFGINVFDKDKMQRYLSQEAYEGVMECIDKGIRIDRKLADKVAAGMKLWAIEMGATHFSHWFHPLTDGTAEKHRAADAQLR
jgi:glutamine synthetase